MFDITIKCHKTLKSENQIDPDAIRGLMDELLETEAMQKKEVTLREYLDGLGEVSFPQFSTCSIIFV